MTDGRHRFTNLTASRRGLVTSAGVVAGAGLAGGFGLARGIASPPVASAATGTFAPIEPSGDTTGATDTAAIQSALTGEASVAWLDAGTFDVNTTISFTATI